jgi:hypothetical protein
MKYFIILFITVTSILALTQQAEAQAWEKSSKVLSIGFGVSQFYHLDGYYYRNNNGKFKRGHYNPTTGQFNFQAEFGIHKYVGLGFTVGTGGRAGWGNNYQGEVNIPMGILANFHFYQLIDDKNSKDLHADKLDIYAGVAMGSGVAFTYYNDTDRRIVPLAWGGPHVGIRYYFAPKVAVNAEAGFGRSLINIGFSFKL